MLLGMADPRIKIEIDGEKLAETMRKLSESLRRLRVEAVTHDESTLIKVRRALANVIGVEQGGQLITDCITEMQNEGILFRERS